MTDQAPDSQPEQQTRACRACHAPLQPAQEWCLACGAAVEKPGRLPGSRVAASIAALTLLLSGGAVAAAYAALTSPTSPPKQLAQAAPPGGNPDTVPAPTTPTTPTVPTTPTLPKTTTPKLPALPEVDDSTSDELPALPALPEDSGSGGTPATPPIDNTTTTTTTTTTTVTPTVVEAKLTPDDIGPYDPDTRIASPPSNRKKLFDGDDTTAWTASAAAGETKLGFGITIDLQDPEQLARLTLAGQAGGIEVYGTKEAELPQSVDDRGWTKLVELDKLNGKKKLAFDKKTKKYDMILLWFTTAPAAGPTVSLSSLAVDVRR